MPINFYDPPSAILASGSKTGVELGGNRCIIGIDSAHNFYNAGNIFTEMSWGEFYDIEGLEDQIDTFTTKEYDSIRDDPQKLLETIVRAIVFMLRNNMLFYGIADFECDAFINQNTIIPGLSLDKNVIITLMEAHKTTRDGNLFPDISVTGGRNSIKIEFQGTRKKNLHFFGSKLIDLAERLNLARGFATGIVCTSRGAANMYIMNDTIIFKKDEKPQLYIDKDNIMIIEMGIQRKLLFPISWFRMDLGIKSLETLELWDEIKDDSNLHKALNAYERYITELVIKKFQKEAESVGTDLEDDFVDMTPEERRKALRDMADAIKFLTKKYKE